MAIGKRDAARAALHNVKSLNPALHDEILDHLEAAGLLDKPANGGAVRAAAGRTRIERVEVEAASNPQIRQALFYAGSKLRQCGVEFSDVVDHERGELSLEKLNSVMARAGKDTDFRIAVKTALSVAGVID
jgi:hypothetical protein